MAACRTTKGRFKRCGASSVRRSRNHVVKSITVVDVAAKPTVRKGVTRPGSVRKGHHVIVRPGESVTLTGDRRVADGKTQHYTKKFQIGSLAIYGGINIDHIGVVTAIGESTVTVTEENRGLNHRMSLYDFSFYNHDFDLAKSLKRNREWTD